MAVAVLCEVVGRYGGTERYWETVLPALARTAEVRLFARIVEERDRFGVPAQQLQWSDEHSAPSPEAAHEVADAIDGCQTVITSNVFDSLVMHAVRNTVPRWIARVHDYRPFCPNGNKVFPQFASVCNAPMGGACVANSLLRGCVQGPRPQTMREIAQRMRLRDELARADVVAVSSRYVHDTCVQNGISQDRIAITPPPLPDAAFSAPAAVCEPTVLFSGRFNDQKGLSSLIRALGYISPARRPVLIVAGTGDERERQNGVALALRHGVDVRWLGWLNAAALREQIDRARVVAVPSLWPEPFGLTGIEAQARGRPVVAYEVGGVTDWLGGGGIAVPRGDEHSLANAIERLLHDDMLWHSYSQAARGQAERFRLDRHLQVLQSLVAINGAQGGR